MFDYTKIAFTFKVKSNLLIFVFLYFIISTESVLLSKINAKNGNYSFDPTTFGSLFVRKQNKNQCFIPNKIKRINNSCKRSDTFEDSNSQSITQDNFVLEAYGYTHDPNFNYTTNFRNRYNIRNKTYTTPPAVFNNIPNNQYNPAQNIPFNRIHNQTYQQNGFNLYNRQLIPYPVVSNSYGNIPFGQNQMQFSQQQYPQQLNRFPPQIPFQTVKPLQNQVPIPPTFQFRYQPPIQTINQVPFQQTTQQYSQVPFQQPSEENIKKNEPGKIVGSRYWQKRAAKFHNRSVRYSSFQLYEDVVWINNYEDDWPGINRIKIGEIYQGIIHYYFTPFDGLILLADKKVEGSMSMKDLPESFSKTTVRETFKLDHLLSFKLKEPLEFDEKGRPKFVLALDYQPKTKKYEFRSRVRGRPIFVTNTMAVFKLEDGENFAQVFLANTGVHLTFPINIKMNEIFTKDEVVEMEVVRGPYYPKAVGYLCRIPFETPKGLELRSKYTMVDSVRYDEAQRLRMMENEETPASPIQERNEKQEEKIPFESEVWTLRDFVKKMNGSLKFILSYMLLKTKTPIDPSVVISAKMTKIIYNLITGKREYYVTQEEEDEELAKLQSTGKSPIAERNPVVAILGGVSTGKTSLFSSLCEVEPDPATNYNFGTVEDKYPVTLFDTPGNELLSPIRDNILKASDIALILISSETGVTNDTEESIKLCRKYNKPFIFVLTKYDISTQFTIEDAIAKLADMGCQVEQLGGNYEMIIYSTLKDTKSNKNNLMESILIHSLESSEIKTENRESVKGTGYVLDSGKTKNLGFYSLLLLKNGELRKGDYVSSNLNRTKVKSIKSKSGGNMETVKQSQIAYVYGFSKDTISNPGSVFDVFATEQEADEVSEITKIDSSKTKINDLIDDKLNTSLDQIDKNEDSDRYKYMPAIIRCDVKAIVEPIKMAIEKLKCNGISKICKYKVLDADIDNLTQDDVDLFDKPGIVVAYNSAISSTMQNKLKKQEIKLISGEKIEDIVNAAEQELIQFLGEKKLGRVMGMAQILKVFEASKKRNAAGCVVTYGRVTPFYEARVMRGDNVLYYGKISSLRRTTEEAREIQEGESCGITFEDFNDFKVGDIIEAYSD